MRTPADLQKLYENYQRKRKGKTMGQVKKKTGTCEVCSEKGKAVATNHGVKACSSCMALQSRINNMPEVVIAEMQRLQGTAYFPTIFPAEDVDVSNLKKELEEATGENTRLKELLLAVMTELNLPIDFPQENIVDHIKDSNEYKAILVKQRDDMAQQNAELIETNARLGIAHSEQKKEAERHLKKNAELLAKLEDQRELTPILAEKEYPAETLSVTTLLTDHELLAALNVVADRLADAVVGQVVENVVHVEIDGKAVEARSCA